MKRLIFVVIALGAFYLISTYGYYYYMEDAENEKIFFKKKHYTLQVKFYNIFANQGDGRPLAKLSANQREKVINYCKYRLGIITELSTQAELDRCKYGYTPEHFRPQPSASVDSAAAIGPGVQ